MYVISLLEAEYQNWSAKIGCSMCHLRDHWIFYCI